MGWIILAILPWIILICMIIPELLEMIVITFSVGGIIFTLYALIMYRINNPGEQGDRAARNRERDIEEWKRKWKRRHPSRNKIS